ncbi:MAG: YdeI/OmpD-associated family protein [Terracidiphilus sp.]
MTTTKANTKVDDFIANAKSWREEFKKLRSILLDSELSEDFKWSQPCYTFQGKNVVVIGGLKESCALAFFKGALLKDVHGVLTRPGQHSQSTRWFKFASAREIAEMKSVLKAYIREAIEVEKAGLKVKLKKTSDLKFPEELQIMLDEFPDFKTAFEALTPGRQRAYIYHFSAPKQSKTRESRVLKYMPHILSGKGLLDQ